ncbi:MAG: ATP-dependent helicase, partial [Acholeplasmataceae bacterium]|nr:ATP-dependent helicase [Acholeplasmataceae bacterium]
KQGANRIVKQLMENGVYAEAIHGNKSQSAREKALSNFKSKKIGVLVATDIAARGIDIDELSHVINYDLPETPETYIHRIGRTGRAGLSGVAISFCSQEETIILKDIQKHIQMAIPLVDIHLFSGNFINTPFEKEIASRPNMRKQQVERSKKGTYRNFEGKKREQERYAKTETSKTVFKNKHRNKKFEA